MGRENKTVEATLLPDKLHHSRPDLRGALGGKQVAAARNHHQLRLTGGFKNAFPEIAYESTELWWRMG